MIGYCAPTVGTWRRKFQDLVHLASHDNKIGEHWCAEGPARTAPLEVTDRGVQAGADTARSMTGKVALEPLDRSRCERTRLQELRA